MNFGGYIVGQYELEDNILHVQNDLDLDVRKDFGKALNDLDKVNCSSLVLDLQKVAFIGSRFFADILEFHIKAENKGRKLIIRLTRKIADVAQLLGIFDMLNVEIVD